MAHEVALHGATRTEAIPAVRKIGAADLHESLQRGLDDFLKMPSHVVFLCLLYPIAGLLFARIASGYDLLPLLFPLIAGFALIGPVAAIGIYELSRRLEKGLHASWREAFGVLRSRSLPAIGALAAVLMGIFIAWLVAAQTIFDALMPGARFESFAELMRHVLATREGWMLILIGNAVGFLFALAAFSISVVSFPLLLDRRVGFSAAVGTSLEAVRRNLGTMALWAFIIALALVLGSLPLLMGLAVVLPILGHASWHLYRRTVDADGSPRPGLRPRHRTKRFAADFPSAIVPWTR